VGLLLDLGYATVGLLASPVLLFKMASDRRYRHRLGERFGGAPRRDGEKKCIWLHCASVGEVNVAKPLVRELKKRHPEIELNVSTTTMAGRENAEKTWPGARVHYWPFDFGFAVRRAIRRVRPDVIVLIELEVWPNFVRIAERKKIPIVIANGRVSHRAFRRYRRLGWYFRSIFRRLPKVGAQSDGVAQRLVELGVPMANVTVTGNLKYDAELAFDPVAARSELRSLWGVKEDERLLVGGSTHDPEETILVETYLQLKAMEPGLRLLIAPRHLERVSDVVELITKAGLTLSRRSQPNPGGEVLLLDTVGELAKTYAASDVVFIGGTFCARGGQNPLEPAAVGKPIVGGPSVANFQEVVDELAAAGGMRVLAEPADLAHAVLDFVRDPERAKESGAKAKQVLERGKGAVARTMEVIEAVLSGPGPRA